MNYQWVTRGTPAGNRLSKEDLDVLGGSLGARESLTLNALANVPQWVAWRTEPRNGKDTKIPYATTRKGGAKADDPATWGTRALAEKRWAELKNAGRSGGIGFELGPLTDDPAILLGGLDLDSCLNDGDLLPWAAKIVQRFDSYTEVSPSGKGLKVFFTYDPDDAAALRAAINDKNRKAWSKGEHHEIGLDISNRYYTVTGERWDNTPHEIRPVVMATLYWLIEEAGPAFMGEPSDGMQTDRQKIDQPKAKKNARDLDQSGKRYGV